MNKNRRLSSVSPGKIFAACGFTPPQNSQNSPRIMGTVRGYALPMRGASLVSDHGELAEKEPRACPTTERGRYKPTSPGLRSDNYIYGARA